MSTEFKGTKGKWEVEFDTMALKKYIVSDSGKYIAKVGFGDKENDANAVLISKALEMLNEIEETIKDLLCIQGNVVQSNKTDHRWDGVYEIIQSQIDRKKQLIKEATE